MQRKKEEGERGMGCAKARTLGREDTAEVRTGWR